MRNNFILLVTAIAVLCFLSCMQDHPNAEDVSKEVKISASIDGSFNGGVVTSRAVDQKWQSGDAIGVFMKKVGVNLVDAVASNAKFVAEDASGGAFAPATGKDKINFPFNDKRVDFISYYPYKESIVDFKYEIDVSDQTNLSAIDFLYSDNVTNVNSSDEVVNLKFTHQLTKVVLIISANNTGKELKGLKAKIENVNSKATFLLADGTLTNEGEPIDISFNVNAEGTRAEAMLLPASDISGKRFVVTLDETNYSYTIGDESFVKGNQYNYDITINKGEGQEIDGVTATITDWVDETDSVVFNEDPAESSEEGNSPPDTTPPEGDDGDGDGGDSGDGDTGGEATVGDGTEDNPYTITQALEKTELETKKWVKGYIVGSYTGFDKKSFINDGTGRDQTLALAYSADETDSEMTFPVKLDKVNIRNPINLKTNPTHLKKEVVFFGDIGEYNPAYSIMGIINITKAKLDGATYPN